MLSEFDASRSTGIVACALQPKDAIVAVMRTSGAGDLLLVTRQGMSIRFRQSDASIQGRNARGVRGIGLEAGDVVIGVVLLPPHGEDGGTSVAVVTDQGKAKRTSASDLTRQLRAGKGSRIVVAAKRAPAVIALALAGTESTRWWVWDQAGNRAQLEHRAIQSTVRDGRVFGALEMPQSPTHALTDFAPPPEIAPLGAPNAGSQAAPSPPDGPDTDLFDP
jgi:DNA gyrase/topoisomerase IV subunit A